jgi:hypothetical protein
MRRSLVIVVLLAVALVGTTGTAAGARSKSIGGWGYGCNFGTYGASVSWARKGGPVASVEWTRWVRVSTGPDVFAFEQLTTLPPDDALGASVAWTNMPEGYYAWSVELFSAQGTLLASHDDRPNSQYCYQWP